MENYSKVLAQQHGKLEKWKIILSVEQQENVLRQTIKFTLVYCPSAANSDVEVHQNNELNMSTVQP